MVRHYELRAAVRQKIRALASRREAQARDVFDLCVLVPDGPDSALLDFLSGTLASEQLREGYARSLDMSFEEYRGQVIEFLEERDRETQGSEDAWDEMRLRAAALIEAVQDRQAHQ